MMRWTAPATGIAMCQITELVVVLTRCRDLGFLKRQFKLVNDFVQRFRFCTKPMPAQIGQLQLEFFNQKISKRPDLQQHIIAKGARG